MKCREFVYVGEPAPQIGGSGMSYWDVPERPLEPPEEHPVGYCDHCGGEVYEGDTVYRIDGQCIHDDCLEDFAKDYFADCKEEVEVCVKARAWTDDC